MPRLLLASLIFLAVACRDDERGSDEKAAPPGSAAADPAPSDASGSPRPLDAAPADAPPPDTRRELSWRTDEEAARAEAARSGKPLFVDVSAAWCMPCKRLEEETFDDPRVTAILRRRFVPLQIDVTEQTEADRAVQERLGASSLPAVLVLSPKGEELRRFERFVGPEELLAELRALRE